MTDNWQKIYSSSWEHKLKILQAVLKEQGIQSVIMNKKDSAYLFGEIELYVQANDVLKSKQIIKDESL